MEELGRIAVAIRAARAAAGWNQEHFCKLVGMSKPTVARIETLVMSPKAASVMRMVNAFREAGITMNLYDRGPLIITISEEAMAKAIAELNDISKKRSDFGVPKGAKDGTD